MSGDRVTTSSRPGRLAAVPPGAGAAAMSLGIVSVALHLMEFEAASITSLIVGSAIWAALAVLFVARFTEDHARWVDESDTPPALTGVAATCVLGTRVALLGWDFVGFAALAVASVAWTVLIPAVIRHWTSPTVGVHFLLCVATQGLAVLGATLSVTTSTPWLVIPSSIAFVLGIGFYLLVLVRFSFSQLKLGQGDHWVFGGALAITALASGKLTAAGLDAGWPDWIHTGLQLLSLALVLVVFGCYLVLAVCEFIWPRLHFDIRRWSTTFPMGMTSAAALTISASASVHWLHTVGWVLMWPAAVLCLVLLVASARWLRQTQSPTTPPRS